MAETTMGADSNGALDDHVEGEIAACLDVKSPRSFFSMPEPAQARRTPSSKRLSLSRSIACERHLRGQQVAVVTYTNAARDEILRRIRFDPTFYVGTIHSFAWKLIGGFNDDIRVWLRKKLQAEIEELKGLESKGRPGTKASITRLAQIESKNRRLERLDEIRVFTYSPSGDNRGASRAQSQRSHRNLCELPAKVAHAEHTRKPAPVPFWWTKARTRTSGS